MSPEAGNLCSALLAPLDAFSTTNSARAPAVLRRHAGGNSQTYRRNGRLRRSQRVPLGPITDHRAVKQVSEGERTARATDAQTRSGLVLCPREARGQTVPPSAPDWRDWQAARPIASSLLNFLSVEAKLDLIQLAGHLTPTRALLRLLPPSVPICLYRAPPSCPPRPPLLSLAPSVSALLVILLC